MIKCSGKRTMIGGSIEDILNDYINISDNVDKTLERMGCDPPKIPKIIATCVKIIYMDEDELPSAMQELSSALSDAIGCEVKINGGVAT